MRLRFAGSALVQATVPALAHLRARPAAQPGLTVYLCDSVSTTTAIPPPTWTLDEQEWRGEVPGMSDARFHTSYHPYARALNMMDARSNEAVFWVHDARELHFGMKGAPIRDILHWWLAEHGVWMVHGAGVGMPQGGVLLTGRGSSGKSTTALLCVRAGMGYAGDDHVAVQAEPGSLLFSLYNTAQLDLDGRYGFSELVPGIRDPECLPVAKVSVFLHEQQPGSLVRGFPLQALVALRVTDREESHLRVASRSEMLLALAPGSVYALPGAGDQALRGMASLVQRVPCYLLELGIDLERVPRLIEGLLEGPMAA